MRMGAPFLYLLILYSVSTQIEARDKGRRDGKWAQIKGTILDQVKARRARAFSGNLNACKERQKEIGIPPLKCIRRGFFLAHHYPSNARVRISLPN